MLHKFAVSHKNTQKYGLRRLWCAMYRYCCYRERCLKTIEMKQKYKAVSSEWVPNYQIFNLTYSGGFLKLYYLLTFKHWRVHTKCCLYSFLLKVRKSDIDLCCQQMSPQKEHPLAGTSGFSFFISVVDIKLQTSEPVTYGLHHCFHSGKNGLQKPINYLRYLHSLADTEKKLYKLWQIIIIIISQIIYL